MRPLNTTHSALQTPLDEILGYKAHVRILRCLIEADQPMGYSELTRRTGVTLQGIRKAVDRLFESGILSYTGSGKQKQIGLRQDHPLANPIKTLITAEKEYFESLLHKLRTLTGTMSAQLKSAWIYGPAALGTDQYGDMLQIGILADLKQLDQTTNSLKQKLFENKVENDWDVTIEVIGYSKADLESRPEIIRDPVILLCGAHPKSYLETDKDLDKKNNKQKDHHDLDKKTRQYVQAQANLIEQYPELISRTITYLETHLESYTKPERSEMQEWLHFLTTMSHQRLRKFLLSDTQRAKRLLQSNPFWQVFNDYERSELEREIEKYEQRTT